MTEEGQDYNTCQIIEYQELKRKASNWETVSCKPISRSNTAEEEKL